MCRRAHRRINRVVWSFLVFENKFNFMLYCISFQSNVACSAIILSTLLF